MVATLSSSSMRESLMMMPTWTSGGVGWSGVRLGARRELMILAREVPRGISFMRYLDGIEGGRAAGAR